MSFYITHNGNALRDIDSEKHKIAFVRKRSGMRELLKRRKQEVDVTVSTPEATLFDLIEQQKRFGLSRISEIAIELLTQLNKTIKTALLYPIASRQETGLHIGSFRTPL